MAPYSPTRSSSQMSRSVARTTGAVDATGNANPSLLQLSGIPPEIVQEILGYVLPKSVLPFALTCKSSYQISLPLLYRQITLTPTTLPLFISTKVIPGDRSLIWVQDVKLSGTWPDSPSTGKPSPEGKGDQDPFTLLLSSLPSLRSAEVLEASRVLMGWCAFQRTLQRFPDTMERFAVRVHSQSNAVTWDETHIYASYHHLGVDIDAPPPTGHQKYSIIPPTLSKSFPNLTSLSITFRTIPYGLDSFLRQSHFPSLRIFEFHAHHLPDGHIGSFVKFIARHARSLLELNVPTDFGPIIRGDLRGASATPLRLKRFHGNPTLFFRVIRRFQDCRSLSTAKISYCPHIHQQALRDRSQFGTHSEVLPSMKAFPSVRAIAMGVCVNVQYPTRTPAPLPEVASTQNAPLEFSDFRGAFPNLRELYIDVPRETTRWVVFLAVRDAKRDLAACRKLGRIALVASDGCAVLRFRGGYKPFGERGVRLVPCVHSAAEFAFVKAPTRGQLPFATFVVGS